MRIQLQQNTFQIWKSAKQNKIDNNSSLFFRSPAYYYTNDKEQQGAHPKDKERNTSREGTYEKSYTSKAKQRAHPRNTRTIYKHKPFQKNF